MTITTEQKLEAAFEVLHTWNEYTPSVKELSKFGREYALATLSTAAKEIEKLTGAQAAMQTALRELSFGTEGYYALLQALARFKELVG